jgi:hypothetical protein
METEDEVNYLQKLVTSFRPVSDKTSPRICWYTPFL